MGTWGQDHRVSVSCIVKPKYRKRIEVFTKLDDAFLTGSLSSWPLLPPRKYSTYRVQSEHLGVWVYIMTHSMQKPYEFDTSIVAQLEKKIRRLLGGISSLVTASGYPFSRCESLPIRRPATDSRWYETPLKEPLPPSEPWRHYQEETVPESDISITRNALGELPILSWPKDVEYDNLGHPNRKIFETSYSHYKKPGFGTVVYVLDSGFDLSHPEFVNTDVQDWIFTGKFPAEEDVEYFEESMPVQLQHGTAMAGLIVGKRTGIAQDAELVVATRINGYGVDEAFGSFDGILRIYDHIKAYNPDRPCIINVSLIFKTSVGELAAGVIEELNALGNVIVVLAAGNGKPTEKLTGNPTILATRKDMKRLIIAGGSNGLFRNLYQFDDKFLNMVWAPVDRSVLSVFPDPRTPEDQIRDHMYYQRFPGGGTSVAAALVSGMLATYISRNMGSFGANQMDDAVKKLKDLSYKRNPGDRDGVKIIWNGITSDQWPE
ncbi:hypothetical protein TWF281_007108 [Arthrobotrys megalospora]